ncbi:hypothetical protein DAPPUDRAFT_101005 [Daphnia pulex]|uniref:Uncharacterized protein n=1 Tax=Daphnia pulex TaxID=6669 RepID=E9GBY1_DAPPU|nr:hypothetical protein DAPPUDRAFT_101005 [Daphnia pulex]|eukprot:EFX83035.1 hypothetical protein DAPPUDRAFT_101005 [Daphnia pulex]
MENLCFLFGCLSLTEKRKRTFEYEDEGIGHRRPKRICLTKSSELNVGLQNIGEKIRLERPNKRPKMDAGDSPLPRDTGMEVDKNVEEIAHNLPRDEKNNRHRLTTHPEPNPLSVRNTNRFNTLPAGRIGKGQLTRQPDCGHSSLKKNLVVNSSDRGRIVDSKGPNVTVENVKDLNSLLDSKRKEFANFKIPRKVESHPSDSLTGSQLNVTYAPEVDETPTPKMPKKPEVTIKQAEDLIFGYSISHLWISNDERNLDTLINLDSKRKELATFKIPRKVESHPSGSLTGSQLNVTCAPEVDETPTPKMPKKKKVTFKQAEDQIFWYISY